ncbi:MAG: SLC13 family permease [Acidobacteria bacterium]|nr:SLC13 family permease [Acidobacteriota bacterium]
MTSGEHPGSGQQAAAVLPGTDVSPDERKPLERKKSLAGFLLGPALFAVALLLPPPEGVTEIGMRSLGVFLWVMAWWVAEPIPLPATAFLSLVLLILCGVFPLERAFGFWAHWVNLFLIGACIIGQAMNIHGVNKRFAYWIMSLRVIGNSSWRLMLALLWACALLSAIASNTVCTILFTSIALSFIRNFNIAPRSRYSVALLVCVPWAASIGGTATPVGAAGHLYSLGLLREMDFHVGFLPWMMFGVPMMLIAMAAMMLVIRLVFRPEFEKIQVSSSFAREELRKLGPVRRGEKISVAVLLAALALWMLPDLVYFLVEPSHPAAQWVQNRLSWAVVALLAAMSLFIIPVNWKERRFAMTWDEAVKGIHWGVLAIVAGALAIGTALSSTEVGLGQLFVKGIGLLSEYGGTTTVLVAASIVFLGLLTNGVSNFASMSIVIPIMLPLAAAPGSGLNPVALTLCLGLTASWAFALPSATPLNAIAFSSGIVRTSDMFRGGIVLAVLCTLASILIAYPLLNWIFS